MVVVVVMMMMMMIITTTTTTTTTTISMGNTDLKIAQKCLNRLQTTVIH